MVALEANRIPIDGIWRLVGKLAPSGFPFVFPPEFFEEVLRFILWQPIFPKTRKLWYVPQNFCLATAILVRYAR